MEREQKPVAAAAGEPQQLLSVTDGIFLTAGMVIGIGIFKLPGLVAMNAGSVEHFFLAWILGGVACLCGALVYAELASRYPETGGEYLFLRRGLGEGVAFVFAWSRMTVIQTGAIAAVAFVFGEYATQLAPLGSPGASAAIWAVVGVVALTGLNLVGTRQSKTLQKVMEVLLIVSLAAIAVGGIVAGGAPAQPAKAPGSSVFTLMMIFVLYTFGGWNEGAYLAGEVRNARRDMVKILSGGLLLVTVLYLLVNWGYYQALGLSGIAQSKAIAVDTMRSFAGDRAAAFVAIVVCVSALTTMNAAIFTGARTNWALGRDFRLFSHLGSWRQSGSTPANALLLQLAIMLVLIWAGSTTRDGFEAMVAYGLPVFWTFLLLTGATQFVFRARGEGVPEFRTPLYPVIPLLFLAMCAFMLWSSFDYVANSPYGPKFGVLVGAGLVVMLAGIPLYFAARRK
ncbi:MAG: APC family permease [Betaproteobacteria bacterium]|nr:APC family permease [Betaproteobacteria bacterium]